MGQYHYTVNLSKHEFIHPHKLGDGLKLVEQSGWSPGGTNDALHLLLACSNGRGGGDFQESNMVGRWAGDRIAVVGDYANDGDLPAEFNASTIYARCQDEDDLDDGDDDGDGDDIPGPRFRDITDELIPVLEAAYEIIYYGDGWRQRRALNDAVDGWEFSHRWRDERVARVDGRDYRVVDIIAAIKANPPQQDSKFRVAGLTPVGSDW